MTHCSDPTLTRLIFFMAQDIKTLAERYLAPDDLTLEQFKTMKALEETGGVSQRRLGDILVKTPANITRILDRLEAKELLERRQDPSDRRACLILLTKKGRQLLKKVRGRFDRFTATLHQGLTDEMQQAAKDVLGIMRNNLDTLAEAIKEDQR